MNECQLIYAICQETRAYAVSLGKNPWGVVMGNECEMLYTWLQILKSINT